MLSVVPPLLPIDPPVAPLLPVPELTPPPDIEPLPDIEPGLGVRSGIPPVVPAVPPVVDPVPEPIEPLGPVVPMDSLEPVPIEPLEPELPIDPAVPPVCAYSGTAIASAPDNVNTNIFFIFDTLLGAAFSHHYLERFAGALVVGDWKSSSKIAVVLRCCSFSPSPGRALGDP
jgi:hypothetical protein